MKNSIEKFFDLESELFNPRLCFLDDWFIDLEDSIVKDNADSKKLFEFINNYFYEPIKNNIMKDNNLMPEAQIVFSYNRDTHKRGAFFSTFSLVYNILESLILTTAEDKEKCINSFQGIVLTEEEINIARDLLRKDIRRYRDVLENKEKSDNYDLAVSMYKTFLKQTGSNYSFDKFYNSYYKSMTDLRINMKKINSIFSKTINYDKFKECFNYDKLCLIIVVSFLENLKDYFKTTNLFNYSINFIRAYLNAVEQIRKVDPHYNVKIKKYNELSKKYDRYDIDYVIREVNKLLVANPAYSSHKITIADADRLIKMYGYDAADYTTKEGYLLLEEVLKRAKEDKELAADWEFIPNTQENKDKMDHFDRKIMPYSKLDTSVDANERNKYMLQCKQFLDESPFVYKVYGEKYFCGYIGYIYSNGKVVFEKFYENEKTGRITNGNATYVMDVISFLKNSKISKSLLISKISSGEITDVRRIFHRIGDFDTWSQNISQVILGQNYSDEVVKYIDNIVKSNEISKVKQLVKKD